MRKINFDKFVKMKKDKYFKAPALLKLKRGAKRRPRDPEERQALMHLDFLRREKWIKNGDLIEACPKKYIIAKVFSD